MHPGYLLSVLKPAFGVAQSHYIKLDKTSIWIHMASCLVPLPFLRIFCIVLNDIASKVLHFMFFFLDDESKQAIAGEVPLSTGLSKASHEQSAQSNHQPVSTCHDL